MTAPTPEQMRARADRLETSARSVPESDTYAQALVFNALGAADAIRAAADQLEAVRKWSDSEPDEPNWSALDAILNEASDD